MQKKGRGGKKGAGERKKVKTVKGRRSAKNQHKGKEGGKEKSDRKADRNTPPTEHQDEVGRPVGLGN